MDDSRSFTGVPIINVAFQPELIVDLPRTVFNATTLRSALDVLQKGPFCVVLDSQNVDKWLTLLVEKKTPELAVIVTDDESSIDVSKWPHETDVKVLVWPPKPEREGSTVGGPAWAPLNALAGKSGANLTTIERSLEDEEAYKEEEKNNTGDTGSPNCCVTTDSIHSTVDTDSDKSKTTVMTSPPLSSVEEEEEEKSVIEEVNGVMEIGEQVVHGDDGDAAVHGDEMEKRINGPVCLKGEIQRLLCECRSLQKPLMNFVFNNLEEKRHETAIVCESETLSYEGYIHRTISMAQFLSEDYGVKCGTHVAVLMPKSGELLATLGALNLLGAPFTILDTRMNVASRQHVWKKWAPHVVICEEAEDLANHLSYGPLAGMGGLAEEDVHTQGALSRSERTEALAIEKHTIVLVKNLRSGDTGSNLGYTNSVSILTDSEQISIKKDAFVDWTSGTSSGHPKGMVMWHKMLINMLMWRWHCLPMDEDDNVCAVNLFMLWYWWYPLCMGKKVVIIPDHMLVDHVELIMYLADKRVTRWDCTTPTLYRAILLALPEKPDDGGELGQRYAILQQCLKLVVFSGEPFKYELIKLSRSKLPNTKLLNLMSTTEAGDVSSCLITDEIVQEMERQQLLVAPVGMPVWNANLHIIPICECGNCDSCRMQGDGELCVGGSGIVDTRLGYYEDPEISSKYFKPSPFGGDILWYTKDAAVKRQFGSRALLYLLGRLNSATKLRGFKIDLDTVATEISDTLVRFSFKQDPRRCFLRISDTHCTVVDWNGSELLCALVALRWEDKKMRFNEVLTSENGQECTGPLELGCLDGEDLLRSLLRRSLPSSQMPQRIMFCFQLPITVTGKMNGVTIKSWLMGKQQPILFRSQRSGGSSPLSSKSSPGGERGVFSPVSGGAHKKESKEETMSVINGREEPFIEPTTLHGGKLARRTNNESIKFVRLAWEELLGIDCSSLAPDSNFFDLGGNSLHITLLSRKLKCGITEIFKHVTLEAQSKLVAAAESLDVLKKKEQNTHTTAGLGALGTHTIASLPKQPSSGEQNVMKIAVVGMAVRWPGSHRSVVECGSLATAWESIRNANTETEDFGPPLSDSHVNRGVILPDSAVSTFDAHFWGMPERKAETIDPNQRIFLELCYEALLNAGLVPRTKQLSAGMNMKGQRVCPKNVGVFASSASLPTYLTEILGASANDTDAAGGGEHWLDEMRATDPAHYWELEVGNDKDYISTRVSYFLDLVGPSMNVQSACSSGLLSIHEAVQALRSGSCEQALCGAVSIFFPQPTGHTYTPGMVFSEDGYCRSFDAEATGMMNANAGACFVLKPAHLVEPEDRVYGFIAGTGMCNDGREKHSYDAPSEKGQMDAIRRAHSECPNFMPDVLEAHGTGTKLGDTIEIEAFKRSIDELKSRQGFNDGMESNKAHSVSISSVKSNIGHANTAAGAMGFLRLLLQLHHQEKCPLATLKKPNPLLNLGDAGQLKLQTTNEEWVNGKGAVSSFGIGGTNIHMLVEAGRKTGKDKEWKTPLLLLSAHTQETLQDLRTHLEEHDPSTIAYTLAFGRPHLRYRLATTSLHSAYEMCGPIVDCDGDGGLLGDKPREVTFLFPGQGSQYAGMAQALYKHERFPVFTETVDKCARVLKWNPLLAFKGKTNEEIHLGLFILHIGLANVLKEQFGIVPSLLLGHSLGEYACATMCGIFSLPDALELVALRGRCVDELINNPGIDADGKSSSHATPSSEMLSVATEESNLPSSLPHGVTMCCRNAPNRFVFGGKSTHIHAFQQELQARGISSTRIQTKAAFHTEAVHPMVIPLRKKLATTKLNSPTWQMISSCTGKLISDEEARDPEYWIRQMLQPVEFSRALGQIPSSHVLLEVGPGQVLSTLARLNGRDGARIIPTMMKPKGTFVIGAGADERMEGPCQTVPFLLEAVGRAWAHGASIDLARDQHWMGAKGKIVSLPPVVWHRTKCWPSPGGDRKNTFSAPGSRRKKSKKGPKKVEAGDETENSHLDDPLGMFYEAVWVPQPRPHVAPLREDAFIPALSLDDEDDNNTNNTTLPPSISSTPDALERVAAQAERYGRLCIVGLRCEDNEDPEKQLAILKRLIRILQAVKDLKQTLVLLHHSMVRYAPSAAFCRSAQRERLDLNLRIVWLDPSHIDPSHCWLDHARREFSSDSPSNAPSHEAREEVRYVSTERQVRRLVPLENRRNNQEAEKINFAPDKWVVITGGTSGIGKQVAQWALGAGARVCVLSRRPPNSAALIGDDPNNNAPGCKRVIACDVSDKDAFMNSVVNPLGGVSNIQYIIHCAGVVADRTIGNIEPTDEVLLPLIRAKVDGAKNICDAVAGSLDTRVVFCSSSSNLLGIAGQSVYCFANEYMDALAETRTNVVALNWGGWTVGMTETHNIQPLAGEDFLSPADGLAALSQALVGGKHGSDSSVGSTSINRNTCVMKVKDWLTYADSIHVPHCLVSPCIRASSPHALFSALSLPGDAIPFDVARGNDDAIPSSSSSSSLMRLGLDFLHDHRFEGKLVVPATFWLEVFVRCARSMSSKEDNKKHSSSNNNPETQQDIVLEHVEFLRTCHADESVEVQAIHVPARGGEKDSIIFEVRENSVKKEERGNRKHEKEGGVIARATWWRATRFNDLHILAKSWGPTLRDNTQITDHAQARVLYDKFSAAGFEYGPRFKLLDALHYEEEAEDNNNLDSATNVVSAKVIPEPCAIPWALGANAATIDACTHIASLVHSAGFGGIPRRIKRVEVCTNILGNDTHNGEKVEKKAEGRADEQQKNTEWRVLCTPGSIQSTSTAGMACDLLLLGNGNRHSVSLIGFDMEPWVREEDVYEVRWRKALDNNDIKSTSEVKGVEVKGDTVMTLANEVKDADGLWYVGGAHAGLRDALCAVFGEARIIKTHAQDDEGNNKSTITATMRDNATKLRGVILCGEPAGDNDREAIAAFRSRTEKQDPRRNNNNDSTQQAYNTHPARLWLCVLSPNDGESSSLSSPSLRAIKNANPCTSVCDIGFDLDEEGNNIENVTQNAAHTLAHMVVELESEWVRIDENGAHVPELTLVPPHEVKAPKKSNTEAADDTHLRQKAAPAADTEAMVDKEETHEDRLVAVDDDEEDDDEHGASYTVVPDLEKKPIGCSVVPAARCPTIPPGHVEIECEAWGLNFLDVLQAKGLIDLGSDVSLGGETVGRISRLGDGISSDLALNDRVAALTWGGWGTYTIVDARFCVKIPNDVDAHHAATINLCYGTAWLAASWLARVQANERMLVHSGAGGVGMAALAIGKMRGAHPLYATCSNNPQKHEALRAWGVDQEHIFNSHDVAHFVHEVKRRGGVDVLLNSLAGDAMRQSLDLVTSFGGRFVEIGKMDQLSDSRIGLGHFSSGLQYMSAHLDKLMRTRPERIKDLLTEVWAAVNEKQLPFLPVTLFHGLHEGQQALEALSKGTHVGKIVVMNRPRAVPRPIKNPRVPKLPKISSGFAISASSSSPSSPSSSSKKTKVGADQRPQLRVVIESHIPTAWATRVAEHWARSWESAPHISIASYSSSSSSSSSSDGHAGKMEGDESSGNRDDRRTASSLLEKECCLSHDSNTSVLFIGSSEDMVSTITASSTSMERWSSDNKTNNSVTACKHAVVFMGSHATVLRPRCKFVEIRGASAMGISNIGSRIQCDPALIGRCLASEKRFLSIGHWSRFPKPVRSNDSASSHGPKWTAEKLEAWLVEYVKVDPEQPGGLDAFGIDSLGKLQLMHTLTRSGCQVSIADLEGNMSLRELAQQICGTKKEESDGKPKVLCLHGFRTNSDIFRFQLRDLSKEGDFSFVYVNAPHRASGPSEAQLSLDNHTDGLFEWWRCPSTRDADGIIPLETGWDRADCEGLDTSLAFLDRVIEEQGPFVGVIGFSQGAAMAHILASRTDVPPQKSSRGRSLGENPFSWVLTYSSIICRDPKADFHTPTSYRAMCIFDPDDPAGDQCRQVQEVTQGKSYVHSRGHKIPTRSTDPECYEVVDEFLNVS